MPGQAGHDVTNGHDGTNGHDVTNGHEIMINVIPDLIGDLIHNQGYGGERIHILHDK